MFFDHFCLFDDQSCEWAISQLPVASVSKRIIMQNSSNENEFDLHYEKERTGEIYFHTNGFCFCQFYSMD